MKLTAVSKNELRPNFPRQRQFLSRVQLTSDLYDASPHKALGAVYPSRPQSNRNDRRVNFSRCFLSAVQRDSEYVARSERDNHRACRRDDLWKNSPALIRADGLCYRTTDIYRISKRPVLSRSLITVTVTFIQRKLCPGRLLHPPQFVAAWKRNFSGISHSDAPSRCLFSVGIYHDGDGWRFVCSYA